MSINMSGHVQQESAARKKREARWMISTRLREGLIARAVMILADKEASHNAVCKASTLLMRAEAQNQKNEQLTNKRAPKKNVAPIHKGWHGREEGDRSQEAGVRNQEAGVNGQESGFRKQESTVHGQPSMGSTPSTSSGRACSPQASSGQGNQKCDGARMWNIKPEYRELMELRWARIVADPKASQTVLFAVGSLVMRAEAQNQKDEEYRSKNPSVDQPLVVGTRRDFLWKRSSSFPCPKRCCTRFRFCCQRHERKR